MIENPLDQNAECRYCDEQAAHTILCPWLTRVVEQAELLQAAIRRAKELGVAGEQADDALAINVIIQTLERLGTLEDRRDLVGKIQFLVNWADANKLLDDHVFTFPDGDVWEAKK